MRLDNLPTERVLDRPIEQLPNCADRTRCTTQKRCLCPRAQVNKYKVSTVCTVLDRIHGVLQSDAALAECVRVERREADQVLGADVARLVGCVQREPAFHFDEIDLSDSPAAW